MIFGSIVVLVLLLALNALYVAAEFAVVAARPSRIEHEAQKGNVAAQKLLRVLQKPARLDRYISSCQLGITVTSLAVGAVSQATLAEALSTLLAGAGWAAPIMASSIAAVIVLVVLSVLQLVVAEQVPKSIALHAPNRVALRTLWPVQLTTRAFDGFITLLNGSAQGLLRLFGVASAAHHHVHSPEEIQQLMDECVDRGLMGEDDRERLGQALSLSGQTARKLMVPRPRIFAIDYSDPVEAAVESVLRTPHTRVPVYRGSIDNIIGIVHAKDLVEHFVDGKGLQSFAQIMRPVFTVHEGTTADRLIALMRENRVQMAVVLDEFGGTAGLLTLEDVLAEVFGDVADEFSPAQANTERLPDGRVRLPGQMRLDEAAACIGAAWIGDAATIGGHVVDKLGHLPRQGETLELDGARIEIEKVSRRVIASLLVSPPAVQQETTSG